MILSILKEPGYGRVIFNRLTRDAIVYIGITNLAVTLLPDEFWEE